MKRCPQCNRVETDDALVFCRVDGAALISDSASISADSNTAKFNSATASSESKTSILPHTTDASVDRATAATTVLPATQPPGTTQKLSKPKRLKFLIAAAGLAVALLAVTGYFYFARNRTTAIESIAVLPFENQNHDPNTDYLSDGVTESIINNLTQLPNLKVIARSSVFRYKDRNADPIAVGKELGVRAVVTGRITQHGDNLAISAELVDVRDNKQLWGEQYERKVSDLLAVQRDIAREISTNLRRKLSGPEQSRVAKNYTESPEAYQLYLRGRFYWNKRTNEGMRQAIEYFRQAIEKDHNYALAYSGLADCYMVLAEYGLISGNEAAREAGIALATALRIDDSLGEAHTSHALLKEQYERDWAGAEKEFNRALELNPNYSTARQWYGLGLVSHGHVEEGLNQMKRALDLDPVSPIAYTNCAWAHYLARKNDVSLTYYHKSLELDPNYPGAHRGLGWNLLQKHQFSEAIGEFQEAVKLDHSDYNLASLGFGYALSGKRNEAQKIAQEIEGHSRERRVSPVLIAVVHAGLGDKDNAFRWLEKAIEQREPLLAYSSVDPFFDNLRSDSRFSDMLRRIGLQQ